MHAFVSVCMAVRLSTSHAAMLQQCSARGRGAGLRPMKLTAVTVVRLGRHMCKVAAAGGSNPAASARTLRAMHTQLAAAAAALLPRIMRRGMLRLQYSA
ncbi:hypothetical protein JKP88DRAFT_228884 [Tribonema minus]|uniref:Secreted protein n=1 Tax=Tribonema minus TaxID=303371 RepID=A0A835YQL3_9STRA|nr:hypothetical protein JKP88DRAFT_228884 [Tribonema minus]